MKMKVILWWKAKKVQSKLFIAILSNWNWSEVRATTVSLHKMHYLNAAENPSQFVSEFHNWRKERLIIGVRLQCVDYKMPFKPNEREIH